MDNPKPTRRKYTRKTPPKPKDGENDPKKDIDTEILEKFPDLQTIEHPQVLEKVLGILKGIF